MRKGRRCASAGICKSGAMYIRKPIKGTRKEGLRSLELVNSCVKKFQLLTKW
jgi:hypothetical protein